jgi:sugar phosphate isomerase/epimerase|nr:sugar phosphate isomerase/epimerase family protein [uncultured Macellibacteroides sp.]
MKKISRRDFVRSTALLAAIPYAVPSFGREIMGNVESGIVENASKDILFGVITSANNPENDLKIVKDLGFDSCQLSVGTYSSELAKRLSATLAKYKLEVASLTCMGPGDYKWNLTEGPKTIGLVPREYRAARTERLMHGIDFCKEAGIPAVHAHFGFIPEDPNDVLYKEFIEVMKPIAEHAVKQGIEIHFETGQETPVTLLRAIQDIGTGNLFVNYDPANLLMYGKANPVDGLKVIGKYVKTIHAKDGTYPVNPNELGSEIPIPNGDVNFPALVASLKKLNFKGNFIIEYELGEQSKDYLLKTKAYLEKLIAAK